MTRVFDRRLGRGIATTDKLLAKSKWVIWCDQAEHVPVMIDLMIAAGRLSESDRPHCVHWRAVSSLEADDAAHVALIVDADEMLQKAGVRTMIAMGWDAMMQGRPAYEAFCRDLAGQIGPAELAAIDELERQFAPLRTSRA
jgi:hypothetical protein